MPGVASLSVQDYARWRSDGQAHVLLDVREDWELATAALPPAPGCTLIPLPMQRIPANVATLRRHAEGPIVCLCHAGIRSAQVAHWLADQGFDQVMNLSGGIEAWSLQVDATVPRY